MGNRLNQIPDNGLERMLRELEATSKELKARQFVSGSNLVFYTNQTDDDYDWSGLLPQSPQTPTVGTKILRVIATAETMDNLYGDLIVWPLYVGGPSSIYRPSDFLAASPPGFMVNVYEETFDVGDRRKKQWIVAINGDKTTTVYFKPYVVASDKAEISIEEVN